MTSQRRDVEDDRRSRGEEPSQFLVIHGGERQRRRGREERDEDLCLR